MQLSSRAGAATASPTLALTAKVNALKAAGEDIIGFTAGEPDFDTPAHIKDAAKAALDKGLTKYTPSAGIPALRQAICAKMLRDSGLTYEPKQTIATCGGKHALYLIFQALLNPGDAVLLPAPYWVSYVDQTRLAGGVTVILPTSAESGFKLTAAQLAEALEQYPYAKALVLNSPSNPTGSMYSAAELAALAEVIAAHPGLTVISDEIYEHLVYDGNVQSSLAQVEAVRAQTVIVNGSAKAYSMTGWRIGWAVGDAGLIDAMTRIASHETSNPTSIAQHATVAALNGDQGCVETMRQAFEQRKRVMIDGLRAIRGVTVNDPGGAFYAFPDVSAHFAPGETADEFSARLLEGAKLAVVPGNGFGAPRNIRLSYATSMDDINEGLRRLAAFIG